MILKEADLYLPIKRYFEGIGYAVNGEVKGCDVVLTKGDETAIVELKKTFNISLVYQLIDRQKAANAVYAAIPRQAFAKKRRQILHIMEKLNCGLITVAMDSPVKTVAVHLVPAPAKARNSARSRALAAEVVGRNFDGNIGGTSGQKLLTAHRERAIYAACALSEVGSAKPMDLVKKFGCDKYIGQMLRRDYYGWFERLDKGLYALSAAGADALKDAQFAEVVAYYQNLARERAGEDDV